MALPTDVKNEAIALVETYCATKVPSEHDDKIRLEYRVRGNTITIYECRLPWREDFGPDWTSMRICSMQWDPERRRWTLYARNRNDRRLDYPFIDPASSVMPLLRELENVPPASSGVEASGLLATLPRLLLPPLPCTQRCTERSRIPGGARGHRSL